MNTELYLQRKRAFLENVLMTDPNFENKPISESFLRVHSDGNVTIDQAKTVLAFPLKKNDGVTRMSTERTIEQNDTFAGFAMGFALIKQKTAAPGLEKLNFYPDVEVFGANDAATLEAIFGGYFELKFADRTVIEALSMMDFLKVPAIQNISPKAFKSDNTLAVLDAGSGTGMVAFRSNQRAQFDLLSNFHVLSNEMILPGDKSIEANVRIPKFDQTNALTPGSGYTYQLVMFVDGFLIKNTKK